LFYLNGRITDTLEEFDAFLPFKVLQAPVLLDEDLLLTRQFDALELGKSVKLLATT
jgi:hypothetical protein